MKDRPARALLLGQDPLLRAMEEARWGQSPGCPHCCGVNVYAMRSRSGGRQSNGKWRCRDCNRQYTVKTGTPMQDSRAPLKAWAMAAGGANASQVQRACGVAFKSALRIVTAASVGGVPVVIVDERCERCGHTQEAYESHGPVEFDCQVCAGCGGWFTRTCAQATAYLRFCYPCRSSRHSAYKRAVYWQESRERTCVDCGEPTGADRANVHYCRDHDVQARIVAKQRQIEDAKAARVDELANPTKEETWLLIAKRRLSKARSLLPGA